MQMQLNNLKTAALLTVEQLRQDINLLAKRLYHFALETLMTTYPKL